MSMIPHVHDPRNEGKWQMPELYVTIDSELKPSGDRTIERPDGDWLIEQAGPFHFFSFTDVDGNAERMTVGDLNIALDYEEERFVEVLVNTPTQTHDVLMRRDRVHRMLNKIDGYRIRLDEKSAQHGLVVYVVDYDEDGPACVTCQYAGSDLTECYYNGFYLYFCRRHLGQFTSAMKNLRVSNNNS